jgi:hypothetical protein
LAFITESKGKLWLNVHSLEDGKTYPRELFGLDKVLSFDYSQDGKRMVFSGVRFGQTDLYIYYLIGNRQERLTSDHYDDLEPSFVKGDNAIIFSSDRSNDTLSVVGSRIQRNSSKDIFVMDLGDRRVLERITSTEEVNERLPQPFDESRYTYLAEDGSVYDRYLATYDSAISYIDTVIHYRYFTEVEKLSDYALSPLEYRVHGTEGEFAMLGFREGDYRFYIGRQAEGGIGLTDETIELEEISGRQDRVQVPMEILGVEYKPQDAIDIHDYVFSDEEDTDEGEPEEDYLEPFIIDDIEEIIALQSGQQPGVGLVLPKARNYKVNFATDKVLIQVGNAFNNEFYQSAGLGPQNLTPGLSPNLQWGFSDLFEDYKLLAGVNIAGGLNNLGYAVRYDNLIDRLDKSIIFTRQSFLLEDGGGGVRIRNHANMLRYRLSYPLSEVLTIRGDVTFNYQRTAFLVTDDRFLDVPNIHDYHGGLKAEIVFDNTLFKGLNLFNGTRAKAWIEYYREYEEQDGSLPDLGVFGLDVRHYQKIHRDIIMAFRLAGSSSFGDQKVIHYLGAVDNWILPRPQFDDSVPIDFSQNYTYQAMATPMRGFWRNARNGSSAAMASSELRFPVFKYFIQRPIQSDFLANFQIVGFGDVGTAWTGSNPYSDDNSFNNIIDSGDPNVTIVLENQEEPILLGYGFGLRTRLLGYFIRLDWSYGIIDGRQLPSEFYLSLNLDF